LRIAIAGLGGAAARGHLPAIAVLGAGGAAQLACAADPDADRRAAAEALFPGLKTFGSAEEMLAAVEADVLVIATEPSAHARLAALGLRSGLHVLCEKPLALTCEEIGLVAAAREDHPGAALVPVHQYRFSPAWAWISSWLRLACALRRRFELKVEVQREGTDKHAASGWRRDIEGSGGMLIDHGVHLLALAWTISRELEVLAVERASNGSGERSAATLRLGSGLLEIGLDAGATARRTRIEARLGGTSVVWSDAAVCLAIAGMPVLRREVEALSDRAHVDSLYVALYSRMIVNLGSPSWRQRRVDETMSIARTSVSLIEASRRAAASA
jgi:predicted dehydrogenase